MIEEIRSRLEMREDDYRRRGMTAGEARQAALRDFGGVEQTKERYRDRYRFQALDSVIQDVGYAVRTLRRNPALTFAVTLTLALAIGANTAIFSVVHAVLIRPLPFPDPDRLVRIHSSDPVRGRTGDESSIPDYFDWKQRATSFARMGAFLPNGRVYIDGDRDRSVSLLRGSPDLLDLIGARPIIGRLLESDDFRADAPRVVLLARQFWLNQFGGDPGLASRPADSFGRVARLFFGRVHYVSHGRCRLYHRRCGGVHRGFSSGFSRCHCSLDR